MHVSCELRAVKPHVTVLMPVFNGARYLDAQIQSILNQSDVDVSLRIIDDGSTDNSWVLLNGASTRNNVLAIRHIENVGLIPTLSELLDRVDTPYFALADQDDVWDNTKLADSIGLLESSGSSLVYSDVRLGDSGGRVTSVSNWQSSNLKPFRGRDPVPFVYRNPAVGHTIVARRTVAEAAVPLPPDLIFHEAWIIAVAMRIGNVDFVENVLGTYRVHSDNIIGPPRSRGHAFEPTRWQPRRRQATRARALRAISEMDPSVRELSELAASRGVRRVRGTLRFAVLIARYRKDLGSRAVLVEIVLFALEIVMWPKPTSGSLGLPDQ